MTPNMYLDMGIKLARQGEFEGAVMTFCQAIQLDPAYGPAYNNLGLVLRNTNRLQEAEACFLRAIELSPEDSYAYNNLGLVLLDLGNLAQGEECFRSAITLNPQQPEFYNNLGTILEENSRIDEAKAAYCQAITLDSQYAEAYYNLGGLLRLTKHIEEAEQHFLHAIQLRPQYQEAKLALALLDFLRGEYEKGWDSYEEARLKRCGAKELGIPLWRGEELGEASILLFWEYGFGDTMQFVRYAEQVAKLAKKTSLWVQKPLQRLIASMNPALTVYGTDDVPPGKFDFACSFLSLPVLFNTSNETVPRPVPYRLTDGLGTWEARLTAKDNGNAYRVGVVWAGHPKHLDDGRRSIAFSEFQQLFNLPNINWVSLQVGVRSEDLVGGSHNVMNFSDKLVDFMETGNLIANLDLVITVDSAVGHLAATMGKQTWILLSYDADWRWQLEREDSPWYPTVRLFRQRKLNDWQEVLERVRSGLSYY